MDNELKFLDLDNPKDLKRWDKIVSGRDTNLHYCPYESNQKECPKCQFDGDEEELYCDFTLITSFKWQCELLPIDD